MGSATTPASLRWVMAMDWHDLLFAHWPVDAGQLQRLLPTGLPLDLFHGQAWLGIVPFRMTGVRPRGFPSIPGIHAFPELNIRTYVTIDGKPGVWFFSLDAASRLAVRVARRTFYLPYMDAHMLCEEIDGWIQYRSRRIHRGEAPAELTMRYRSTGPVFRAVEGSLEFWLTERYCLYSASPNGTIFRGEIHHLPWPLQTAMADFEKLEMTSWMNVDLPAIPPLLHFSESLSVRACALRRASS